MASASHHSPAETGPAGEHVHGSMDIHEQERTFAGFLNLVAWVAATVIVLLVFLALVSL